MIRETKSRIKIITIIVAFSFIVIFLLGVSNSFPNNLIHDINKSNSIRNYETLETTCNDANGEPNGECFIDAFDECKSARIKQMGSTFEGDPIFYYAHVILSEPCTVHFAIDTSHDTWGRATKGLHQKICTDVTLNNHSITLLCNDDNEENNFPLR